MAVGEGGDDLIGLPDYLVSSEILAFPLELIIITTQLCGWTHWWCDIVKEVKASVDQFLISKLCCREMSTFKLRAEH